MESPSLLLHVCCAPCATEAAHRLKDRYRVTLFFSNSNIAPAEEYGRRLDAARRLADLLAIPLIEDRYDHERWRAYVQSLEDEPERGLRCAVCFEFNLARAARYGAQHGFDFFTTTLTVSPHKNATLITLIGRRLGPFLDMDWKQGDGFRRSVEWSRRYGLFRQTYCGCEFSRRLPPRG